MEEFTTRLDLSELTGKVEKIKTELGKYLVGQNDLVEYLIIALLADGHVLIEGVPGVAKTLTAKLLAKAIDADFKRIQFTPDLMPSDIIGTSIFNTKTSDFEFKKGPLFANIVLTDEINRSPAKTQAALFEAMEERQITVDGNSYKLDEPFMVLATQNPIEYEGTYRLPEAQLDRFLFKIKVNYPTKDQEVAMLTGFHNRKDVNDIKIIQAVLSEAQVMDYQAKIRQIHIEPNLINYISEIIQHTRNNKSLFLGASPRAAIALLSASKTYAAINGRDFIKPEDVQQIAYPVLRHRIMLTPEKEMEGA